MKWSRTTNRVGMVTYTSADGRAEITVGSAVPPPRRVEYVRRDGVRVARMVRYRKKRKVYYVKVDGRRLKHRCWWLGVAKDYAAETMEKKDKR